MKKGIVIILSICILLLLIVIVINNKYYIRISKNNENNVNGKIESKDVIQIKNKKDIKKTKTNENNTEITDSQSKIKNEFNNDNIKNSLPSDEGLIVNNEPKTFNQDITAKANIAYLLGCENITDTTDFEEYISKNTFDNGIFISYVNGYIKNDDPYSFIKDRATIMKDMLSSINLIYNIDKNNFLINNKGDSELEQNINKLILGDKKVIIGFIPEYYVYINDINNGLRFGGFDNSSYVSLKPYKNIYTFICNPDTITNDQFLNMIEEICCIAY